MYNIYVVSYFFPCIYTFCIYTPSKLFRKHLLYLVHNIARRKFREMKPSPTTSKLDYILFSIYSTFNRTKRMAKQRRYKHLDDSFILSDSMVMFKGDFKTYFLINLSPRPHFKNMNI